MAESGYAGWLAELHPAAIVCAVAGFLASAELFIRSWFWNFMQMGLVERAPSELCKQFLASSFSSVPGHEQ